MTIFVITCFDKADSLSLRMAKRPEHVDYLKSQSAILKLAGPFLDANGDPNGSLLLVDVEDLAAAQAFAAADPYAQAGLFKSSDVRPMRIALGGLA